MVRLICACGGRRVGFDFAWDCILLVTCLHWQGLGFWVPMAVGLRFSWLVMCVLDVMCLARV